MEISANFAFLTQEFPHAAESASFAERHVFGDPRASCFHVRHALERLLTRVYKVEKALKPPTVTNLDGYISDPAFRELVPEVVWQKAEFVRQAGNVGCLRHSLLIRPRFVVRTATRTSAAQLCQALCAGRSRECARPPQEGVERDRAP